MAVLVYSAPEEWEWGENEAWDPPATWRFGETYLSLSTRTALEYGFTVGLHRIRELLAEFDLRTTFWTNGNVVERQREVIELLVADGHEIGGHGYSEGRPMPGLDRAGQAESIRRSVELLTDVCGDPPRGWLGPCAAADHETIELLVEAGFSYHAELQDDELPYFIHVGDKIIVEIPYRMIGNLNDLQIMSILGTMKSVREATAHVTEAFDAYYKAAESHPLILNYGTHPHITGRPDGSAVLRRFLDHVRSHDDVWVCTFSEMARWWQEQFGHLVPPGGGPIDLAAERS